MRKTLSFRVVDERGAWDGVNATTGARCLVSSHGIVKEPTPWDPDMFQEVMTVNLLDQRNNHNRVTIAVPGSVLDKLWGSCEVETTLLRSGDGTITTAVISRVTRNGDAVFNGAGWV